MSRHAPSLASSSGLRVQMNANGSLRRMDYEGVLVNLFPGSEIEGGPANLYLRRLGASVAWIPLLGPRSPGVLDCSPGGFRVRGRWQQIRFEVSLVLAQAAPAWFWHVALENTGGAPQELDLVYAQDLGLADYDAARLNEYYVSQYVDFEPLAHPERGWLLGVRQNQPIDGRHPWALLGSLASATSFATDALQLIGRAGRDGALPAALAAQRLPGERLQHEHSLAALQDAALHLAPGARAARGFFGWLERDHPLATSPADLSRVERVLALPEAAPPGGAAIPHTAGASAATLFTTSPLLAGRELGEGEIRTLFGDEQREIERGDDGALHSFFSGLSGASRHVVLAAKERVVLRPHAQILRSGAQLVPDEASLTSTVWMSGVFHSMLTQGHVSINRFLSTTRGYLGLFRSHGQRIFVETAGGWQLLGVPSAFEMDPSGCRWVYVHAGGRIEVRSWATIDRHELWLEVEVADGSPCRLLVSHHIALAGDDGEGNAEDDSAPLPVVRDERGVAVFVPPGCELAQRFPAGCFRIDFARGTQIEQVGGDELLFADGRSRGQPFVTIVTAAVRSAALRIRGHLVESERTDEADGAPVAAPAADRERADRFWSGLSGALEMRPAAGAPLAGDAARLQEIVPWFTRDALVHYLAPRGLEQYSGGGWGTRDVCQGPVELLLATGRWPLVRDLLLRVFSNQNEDGDWPQWFMFFEQKRATRAADSHGDIVFWPLLALARYLLASGDAGILDEPLPFFCAGRPADSASLWGHVERALRVVEARVVPGTRLAAYGNGDWNDSLQPADPGMRERLCSAWSATLQHQTLRSLAGALRHVGRAADAPALEDAAAGVRDDFQRLLLAGGVLAGFSYFRADGEIDRLLHPSDASTGIRYRLLPMIHAILADLFTPEQARAHVALIRQHLLGPDGARLFDRPPSYRGGPQHHFQRAETSSFFGREIGILYMHAHLRYAEAMAHWGDADAAFLALRQANPIGLRGVVAAARPRQANCFSSSSDAAFADRYEAAARYPELMAGGIAFEGGWRVYSSGAGIAVHVIRCSLLGLRLAHSHWTIDPVLPRGFDGLRVYSEFGGRPLEVEYRIRELGYGPSALLLNGAPLPFEPEINSYRAGGARVAMAVLRDRLAARANRLVVELR